MNKIINILIILSMILIVSSIVSANGVYCTNNIVSDNFDRINSQTMTNGTNGTWMIGTEAATKTNLSDKTMVFHNADSAKTSYYLNISIPDNSGGYTIEYSFNATTGGGGETCLGGGLVAGELGATFPHSADFFWRKDAANSKYYNADTATDMGGKEVFDEITRVVEYIDTTTNTWNFTQYRQDGTVFKRASGITSTNHPNKLQFGDVGCSNDRGIILYNVSMYSGTSCNPYVFQNNLLNASDGSIPNNYQSNVHNIYFNITVNSSVIFNCTFFINGSFMNRSINYNPGTSILVNYTNTSYNGDFTYQISCDGNGTTTNTTSRWYRVDDSSPTVLTNLTNRTIFLQRNLAYHFNMSDDVELHSFNLTINNQPIAYQADINSTTYLLNITYPYQNLTYGTNILNLTFSDGHTKHTINQEGYLLDNGLLLDYYLDVKFKKPYDIGELSIQQKNTDWFDKWDYQYQSDKVSFSFTPEKVKNKYTFIVEADDVLYIKNNPKTEYKQWIVYKNHYVDFLLDNEPSQEITINRINDHKVEVTIDHLSGSKLQFKSIGDLNTVTKIYELYRINYSIYYLPSIDELEEQNITLSIFNLTNSGLNNTQAALFYGGENRSSIRSSNPTMTNYISILRTPSLNEEITKFWWVYNLTAGNGYNESGNLSFNQSIRQLLIDNCSTFQFRAINFSVYDDSNMTPLLSNTKAYAEIWVTNRSDYKKFNLSWLGLYNFSLCIANATSNYVLYSQIKYVAATYPEETYYINNLTINNNTQLISLLLTQGGTLVKYTVTDQNDDPVNGLYIYVLQYDLGTDSYKTTEILKTDTNGEAVGNQILTTLTINQWYKYLLVYNGNTVLSTDPVKLLTNTKSFRIDSSSNFFNLYNKGNNITHSLTHDNDTNTFTFTYMDPTGVTRHACLEVINKTLRGDNVVQKTCVDAAASSIIITFPPDVSGKGTYYATGTVTVNPTFLFESQWVSYDTSYRQWGKMGLMVSFMLRLTFSMMAIWNPMIAIILLIGMDGFLILAGVFKMSIGVFIAYLILGLLTVYRLNRDR